MKKHRLVSTLLALSLGAAACADDVPGIGRGPEGDFGPGDIGIDQGVPGSGDVVSETRDVAEFDRVMLSGEGSVTIEKGEPGLIIRTDDNLLALIESEVIDSTLHIRTDPDRDIAPTVPPEYTITTRSLAGIDLAGVGEVFTSGWDVSDFEVSLSGVGDIHIGDFTAESLTVDLSGVGILSVLGTADELMANVGGVTEFDVANLEVSTATITCDGDASVEVWATDVLDVTVGGLCDLSYYGDPVVTETITGSGTVRP